MASSRDRLSRLLHWPMLRSSVGPPPPPPSLAKFSCFFAPLLPILVLLALPSLISGNSAFGRSNRLSLCESWGVWTLILHVCLRPRSPASELGVLLREIENQVPYPLNGFVLLLQGNDNVRGRPGVPMEIWNLLDEITGGAPARGSSRHSRAFGSQMRLLLEDDDGLLWYGDLLETRMGELLTSRLMDLDQRRVEPIDANSVLSKCRREVYKPKSGGGSKGKAESDQNECPVCLEKFEVNDQLLSLPCNHKFHTNCLVPWVKSNHGQCPCCRADILSGPKEAPSGLSSLRFGRSSNTNRSTSINPATTIRDWSITSGRAGASSSSRSSTVGGGDGVRRPDDILTVLAEMEALLDRFGFRD